MAPAAGSVQRPHDDFVSLSDSSSSECDLSVTAFVHLHRRVIVAVQQYNSTQCQWNKLIENAVYLEDVGWNQTSGSHVFVRSLDIGRKSVWSYCRCPRIGQFYNNCELCKTYLKYLHMPPPPSQLEICITVILELQSQMNRITEKQHYPKRNISSM